MKKEDELSNLLRVAYNTHPASQYIRGIGIPMGMSLISLCLSLVIAFFDFPLALKIGGISISIFILCFLISKFTDALVMKKFLHTAENAGFLKSEALNFYNQLDWDTFFTNERNEK